MEGSEAEDLLLKAIRSLPQGEQDAVMRSLIGRAFAGPGTPHPVHGSDVFPQQMGSDFTVTPGPAFDTSKQMTAPLWSAYPPICTTASAGGPRRTASRWRRWRVV